MKTAVEWLVEQITTVKWKMSDVTDKNSIIEQAKAMEKEQIVEAYCNGCLDITKDENIFLLSKNSEQYYNETFKTN
jgi:hypothetical protein